MIDFINHNSFIKEIDNFEKKFRSIRISLDGFKKLCEIHFHPTNPSIVIGPGKIHRVTKNDFWAIWKTELPIIKSGLRPSQYPRIWFVVKGSTVIFLCMATHIDNYDDMYMNNVAVQRVTDFL